MRRGLDEQDEPEELLYGQVCIAVHDGVECPAHVHFNMEIVVVSAGILHMSVNGRDYALVRGTGVFVPPFALHDFRSGGVNRCHVLEFPTTLAPELAARLRQGVPEDLGFPVPEDCLARLERQLPQGRFCPDRLHAQAAVLPLCCEIVDHCRFDGPPLDHDDVFLAAVDHMNRNFSQPLTLERVAQAVGVHPVTLSKKFAASARVGFHTYLNHLRVVQAACLLEEPDCTATEAAYLSGFGSIRSFNRIFFERTGVTPTQFRLLPEQERQTRLSLYG